MKSNPLILIISIILRGSRRVIRGRVPEIEGLCVNVRLGEKDSHVIQATLHHSEV